MNPIYATPLSRDLQPSNSTGAYTSGDCLGDPLEIPISGSIKSGNQGPIMFIQSLTLTDRQDKKSEMQVHLFDALPSCVDQAAFNPTQAELSHWVGAIKIAATDWIENGTASCVVMKADLVISAYVPNKSLWAVLVVKATPTYSVTDAIRGKVAGTVN